MVIDWLMNMLSKKLANNFTGNIKINFFSGGITNVMIEESVQPPAREPGGHYR